MLEQVHFVRRTRTTGTIHPPVDFVILDSRLGIEWSKMNYIKPTMYLKDRFNYEYNFAIWLPRTLIAELQKPTTPTNNLTLNITSTIVMTCNPY